MEHSTANLDDNLPALMRDLKTGTFIPKPLRRVLKLHRQGFTVILSADIRSFFDYISHAQRCR